jgi:hypothetical protein
VIGFWIVSATHARLAADELPPARVVSSTRTEIYTFGW